INRVIVIINGLDNRGTRSFTSTNHRDVKDMLTRNNEKSRRNGNRIHEQRWKQAGSGEIRGDEAEIDIKKRQYTKQNLATIALNVEKSDELKLYQESSNHEADMIRSMKRGVKLNVKRIVLYGDIRNQSGEFNVEIRSLDPAKLDIDRGPLTMLVDAALLTKEEIQNEAGERTTLALVIGEGESKRQWNLMS
ncbi:hypothetical protein DL95DRAFT_419376, partial [Leptodontidium sp. 2 PMI_412]